MNWNYKQLLKFLLRIHNCCYCFLQPSNILLYMIDACFSTLVILTLVILVWFALWSIGDYLISPADAFRSYILSLSIGYVVVIAVFVVQSSVFHFAYGSYQRSPQLALAVEHAYKVVATLATLHLWRGLWGIFKDFVLTKDTNLPLAFSFHAVGFVFMILFGVSKLSIVPESMFRYTSV